MKSKRFIRGITFFSSEGMYQQIKALCDRKEISLSEILREAVGMYLALESVREDDMDGNESARIR